MGTIQDDVTAAAMTAAVEANLWEVWALMARWPEAEVHDDPEMLSTITGVAFPMFNMVVRADLAPERADAAIAAVIGRGRARRVPLGWWVGPASRPADLGRRLMRHGFVERGYVPGMAMDLSALPPDVDAPPGLRVKPVRDAETMQTWCEAMVTGSGWPPFTADGMYRWLGAPALQPDSPLVCELGRLDGVPVTTSMLFLGAGVAGIYCVGTLPEARGRGLGTAVTHAALREAQRRGYRVAILQSSEMGHGIYRKLGFRDYARIDVYGWRPEEA